LSFTMMAPTDRRRHVERLDTKDVMSIK